MSRWTRRDDRASSAGPDGSAATTAVVAKPPVIVSSATRRQRAARRVGLRRVDWVRLSVDAVQAPVRAEAVGVAHRLPVTCPVPLSAAADLIASGTPSVVHRLDLGS